MAFSINNRLGNDLTNTFPAVTYGTTGSLIRAPHALGAELWANDGKLYVFAQAGAAITGATAVCSISTPTFQATATGGAYTSPAGAMLTGDYGWFGKASV